MRYIDHHKEIDNHRCIFIHSSVYYIFTFIIYCILIYPYTHYIVYTYYIIYTCRHAYVSIPPSKDRPGVGPGLWASEALAVLHAFCVQKRCVIWITLKRCVSLWSMKVMLFGLDIDVWHHLNNDFLLFFYFRAVMMNFTGQSWVISNPRSYS